MGVLFIAIPSLIAITLFLISKIPPVGWRGFRRLRLNYVPQPRAWDFAFNKIDPTYVRVQLNDGSYLGGWFGPASFVSSYPEPREIFLEIAHHMGDDGTFGEEVTGSGGIYIRCEEVRLVEFVDP